MTSERHSVRSADRSGEIVSDRHDEKRRTMAVNLERQTGRGVSEWVETLKQGEIDGFNAQVTWLKSEHGLGHFQARLVAETLRDAGAD